MKRNILFAFIIFFTTSFTYSQLNWKWMHPTPQGNTIRYAKMFSANEWVLVGLGGTFMKTTNAGVNWYLTHDAGGVKTSSQTAFYNAWFFNMTTGILCGASGQIWRTTNGGLNFDSIPSGVTTTLYGIHFIDASTGFIGGTSGTVLKTTNAGVNWIAKPTGTTYTINNIFALNNRIYCPTSTASILLTSYDGGATWFNDTTAATSNSLYDVGFKDSLNGIVCGATSTIRYTTDAGLTWTQYVSTLPSTSMWSILYNSNTWYISGNSFYTFRSTNDGVSWDSIAVAGNQFYVSTYYFFDRLGTNMLTAGAFGLINSTTNSGANWTAHNYLGYSGSFNDIWVENMNGKVIAVGSAAPTPFLVSTNGGINWIYDVGNGITTTLYGLKMLNATTGYASGASGKMFKTTSGGMNWDSVSFVGASNILYCTDFISADTGWACGSTGTIFKTVNGGMNWTAQTSGITSTLYRIDMIDALTGYFVGASGSVRKTTDGGTTWTAQTSNYSSTLYWLNMFDANTGYLVGIGGTLRKTTNGGTNWDTVMTPMSASQYSISFTNMSTGYIAGASGYSYRTSNGGASWEIKNSGGSSLNAVFAKGYDSAFVAGASGCIQQYYNALVGGITWYNQVPEKFTLEQNYPNPFNPVTTIKFGLPKAAKVTLKVYDILGREVSILFNNVDLNAGIVTYDFDGTDLASGVYFYTLIVNNNKIDTKRMVMLK
ncbi:MAG TPA: YCF48-related protein [Ignavibacteria bacterium]|nr:YCF48-related protein [Ignavibacteria bacterium]HRJ03711.1 YCF48-related protein [Ignavibacteria bacterium]